MNVPYCGHGGAQSHGSDVEVFQVCGLENHGVEAGDVDAHGCHGEAFGSFSAKCWSYEASYHRGHWKLNSCGLWSQSTKDWSPSLPEDKDLSRSQCSNKKLKTCGQLWQRYLVVECQDSLGLFALIKILSDFSYFAFSCIHIFARSTFFSYFSFTYWKTKVSCEGSEVVGDGSDA